MVKTINYSLLALPKCDPQIRDDRKPLCHLEEQKKITVFYLSNHLTEFDEILQ